MRRVLVAAALALSLAALPGRAAETVRLHAAGSLKPAMSEIAAAFAAAYGIAVRAEFGASGLVRERLEEGEAGDIFASADMGNPLALMRAGKAGPVVLFARNRLCAIARPGLAVTPATLLATMLDPAIKLGTSTPKADPSGDYAWTVFGKAETVAPGSRAVLEAKALMLTGGPQSPLPPDGRNVYAWHLAAGRADLFLGYCTTGRPASAELPGVSLVDLPLALATGAEYGLTVLKTAEPVIAATFALYILSPEGQTILARHGFAAPTMPDGQR